MTCAGNLFRLMPAVLFAGLSTACDNQPHLLAAPMETEIVNALSMKPPPPAFVDAPMISFDAAATPGIAVSHTFTLDVPFNEIETIQKRHLAECGKLDCKVMSTGMNRWDAMVHATSSVRLSPRDFEAFVGVISAEPATVSSRTETTEDQALPILEADKRLAVKAELRDRLRAMITEPGGKSPADLAVIEKELAQVQGDIETITAQQRALATITETVLVDVTYQAERQEAAGLDFSPISQAVTGIGQTIIRSAAALVGFLAALVPWSPLIALAGWAALAGLRRWRATRQAVSP